MKAFPISLTDEDIENFETTTQLNARDVNNRNRDNHTGTQAISTVENLQTSLDSKQDSLISGTNIKTVNNESLLGSGNINIISGSTNPSGTNGSIQFNNNGSFGGNSNLIYDSINNRVGIGESLPSEILHIKGNLLVDPIIETTGPGVTRASLQFKNPTQTFSFGLNQFSDFRVRDVTAGNNFFIFEKGQPSNSLVFKSNRNVLFNGGGNVGIALTNPIAKLHVNSEVSSSVVGIFQGRSGQSAALLQCRNSSGSPLFQIKSNGVVNILNIPTSSSGLSSGDVWSDNGTLKIV